jgi:hypothetical protein
MKSLESRFGKVWIDQDSTVIEALSVVATSGGTVQVCIGIRTQGDHCYCSVSDELLVELDTLAAGELAEKLAAVALEIEKGKAAATIASPN